MTLFSQGMQFAFALALVIGLILAAAAVARRLGVAGRLTRGTGRRLAVVEMMVLDARRRLVLVRRDDVEHLILLGGGSETVVETGIRLPARFEALLDRSETADGRTPPVVEAPERRS